MKLNTKNNLSSNAYETRYYIHEEHLIYLRYEEIIWIESICFVYNYGD